MPDHLEHDNLGLPEYFVSCVAVEIKRKSTTNLASLVRMYYIQNFPYDGEKRSAVIAKLGFLAFLLRLAVQAHWGSSRAHEGNEYYELFKNLIGRLDTIRERSQLTSFSLSLALSMYSDNVILISETWHRQFCDENNVYLYNEFDLKLGELRALVNYVLNQVSTLKLDAAQTSPPSLFSDSQRQQLEEVQAKWKPFLTQAGLVP